VTAAETASDERMLVARNDEVTSLVQANTGALLKYFLRRVDRREDAADLLGETLLAVWRRADSVPRDADTARMWMYGVAANVLNNARRASRRRSRLADRLRDELAASGDDIDSAAATERRLDVGRELAKLKPLDRELVRLVHWDGLTLAEAATVTGLNASTARTRYSRARAALAVSLRP
jgi:RNA polymerase sigma-70 factor (ECF subfamily)